MRRFAEERALVCGLAVLALAAPQASQTPTDAAKPTREIDLAKLGYQGLSAEGRLMTTTNVTVNFLDNNHLLFTFNPKKLFQRNPECPPTHKDPVRCSRRPCPSQTQPIPRPPTVRWLRSRSVRRPWLWTWWSPIPRGTR